MKNRRKMLPLALAAAACAAAPGAPLQAPGGEAGKARAQARS
ncbi:MULTISPECIES: hypothetical protein [unclassified Variovorax]|nr:MULTISPECIES: hypothetical protein [unclassified Variovorax]